MNRSSLSLEVSPGSPYSAPARTEPPSGAYAVETLHVGQSGHTSDFERDFAGRHGRLLGVAAAERLENEGRNTFHAGQHRGGGVEQRPVPEIAMGTSHDGRPCRMRHRENADQPAAVPQLAVKPLRHDLGRAVEHDDVKGRVRRIAIGGRGGADLDLFSPLARMSPAFAASAGSLSVAVTWAANLAITAAA